MYGVSLLENYHFYLFLFKTKNIRFGKRRIYIYIVVLARNSRNICRRSMSQTVWNFLKSCNKIKRLCVKEFFYHSIQTLCKLRYKGLLYFMSVTRNSRLEWQTWDRTERSSPPPPPPLHQCLYLFLSKATYDYTRKEVAEVRIWGQNWESNSEPSAQTTAH